MRNILRGVGFATLAVMVVAGVTVAQEKPMKMPDGVRGSYMKFSMRAEEQILSLFGAMPENSYGWRPMEGVRSVSESFVHAASGNYALLGILGGTMPEGLDVRSIEQTIVKKEAIENELKRSFRLLRERVMALSEADMNKEVDFFGTPMTMGDVIVFAVAHQRETLGQEIAYARMNKVVPPWTMKRMEEMKKKETEKKGE